METMTLQSKVAVNKTFDMTAQVEYNTERVEFNQLVKTRYGAVNVVAFKAGQKLDEHVAPATVLIYVMEGEVTFTIEGNKVSLNQGQSVVMEAGTPHDVTAQANSKLMLVKIDN